MSDHSSCSFALVNADQLAVAMRLAEPTASQVLRVECIDPECQAAFFGADQLTSFIYTANRAVPKNSPLRSVDPKSRFVVCMLTGYMPCLWSTIVVGRIADRYSPAGAQDQPACDGD